MTTFKKAALALCITASLSTSAQALTLTEAGRYAPDTVPFGQSAAEIVAYSPTQQQAYIVNALSGQVDVIDLSEIGSPIKIESLDIAADVMNAITGTNMAAVNSVAVHGNLMAAAIEANPKQDIGYIAVYQLELDGSVKFITAYPAGALPDMVTFSPNGHYILSANEGEPNDDYTLDPEGSITIVDIRPGLDKAIVRTADFTAFNDQKAALIEQGIRIFGPGASVAQDLEPEYITITSDSRFAWVALQENNALAKVDIEKATVDAIYPLGYKDHSLLENAFDASDKDDKINIRQWPVLGIYQPDTISLYEYQGQSYILTANEGDARDYKGFSEEFRVADIEKKLGGTLAIDTSGIPAFEGKLTDPENLGRLRISAVQGANSDCTPDAQGLPMGCTFDSLYSYGARSFSIWKEENNQLVQVYDSANEFERIIAERFPEHFNSNHSEQPSFDSRSDDKGAEPEALAVGQVGDKTYAFIGMERMGGIFVYDITNPYQTEFVDYVNNRNFDVEINREVNGLVLANPEAGDLGPEGMAFVHADQSPTGKAMLLVGSEVSGSLTVYFVE
ncbi:choice-of-anchor I family protein [Nitrincola alkalisediminis]|uniref:choice-of-anchor I family protein n=1 Tax=Nitrincola alkalisediminis TaxID=1366656 RepID=UPI001CA82AAA|nr:choice-of-anchor I family protein [Nitrincola alkalisediminis]